MTRIGTLLMVVALAAPCGAALARPTPHHAKHHPKPPPEKERLADALDPSMLSLEVPAYEKVAGPPVKVWADGRRDYVVDDCQVTALTSGTTVTGLKLTLTDACSFDLNRFFMFEYDFPSANQMMLGEFNKTLGTGKITADCLTACADGTATTLHEHFIGSIYLARLQIKFDIPIDDDARRAALAQWTTAMGVAGPDYPATARYNCDDRFDQAADDAFAKIKPSAVTIGYNLKTPKC